MELNLGKLIDTEVRVIENPRNKTLARVRWVFEKAELKWGTITESKVKEDPLWVQMPHFSFFASGKKKCWATPLMITDKPLENELKMAALKIFTGLGSPPKSQTNTPGKEEDEEINLDEIPF